MVQITLVQLLALNTDPESSVRPTDRQTDGQSGSAQIVNAVFL